MERIEIFLILLLGVEKLKYLQIYLDNGHIFFIIYSLKSVPCIFLWNLDNSNAKIYAWQYIVPCR
jgi:hypothetical protein